MGVNAILKSRMDERGLTQDELAQKLNDALHEITGSPGDISARTVRNLLSGRTRRPIGRTCVALESSRILTRFDKTLARVAPDSREARNWREYRRISRKGTVA